MAVETNYYQRSSLNQHKCTRITVLEVSLQIKVLAGCLPSGGSGENVFSPLLQLLEATCRLWLVVPRDIPLQFHSLTLHF